jgi:hypothetical protein
MSVGTLGLVLTILRSEDESNTAVPSKPVRYESQTPPGTAVTYPARPTKLRDATTFPDASETVRIHRTAQ